MERIDSLIAARIASLQPFVGEDWDCGPYTEEELRVIEQRLGRSLDPDHRDMLKEVGGGFSFRFGPVDVKDSELDVLEFLGASATQYNIADKWYGARDCIPSTWYPFARDFDGCLYCLTNRGAVHYIVQGELPADFPEDIERPETAGERVADSFVQFVMSLRLPRWAADHLRETSGGSDGNA